MAMGGKLLVGLISAILVLSLGPALPAAYASSGPPAARLDNVTTVAAAIIWYVDQDATGKANGTSWADAYNYLQDALAAAGAGDEIWVAEGTYKPDQGGGNTAGDRAATFALLDGVAIYGGFVGGETSRDGRDWRMNETVLSGDLGSGYHSYHVVRGSGTSETAILDGFTITAGNANGSLWPTYYGGGMYNYEGSPTVTNCTFSGNAAGQDGGGMYNYGGSPTVTNCTFSGNAAEDGGAIYNDMSSPTVTNCIFSGNAVVWEGGGIFNFNNSSPTVTNCIFSGNAAYMGGGMLNNRSSGSLTNCIFSGNGADIGGGMANFAGSSPIAVNCTFSDNSAVSYGGAMLNDSSSPIVINCTFSSNAAVFGGGMDNYDSFPAVANCILYGNSAANGAQFAVGSGSTLTVSYSDVQGGQAEILATDGGMIDWGPGNIDLNPEFVGADGLDDDLRLSPGSPCIDAGDNTALPPGVTSDLDGHQRIVDGDNDGTAVVDMGAYECESEESSPEEEIQVVVDDVDELFSQGVLNQGQGNALKSKLWSALSALARGRTNAAVNQLQAFINQVNAYQKAGVLTEEEADALRDAIENVINGI